MPKVVFDIETAGQDFETLDNSTKDYLLKFAETEEEIAAAKDRVSLYPVTAQVVAIGMLDVDTDKGAVYFQNGGKAPEKFTEGDVTFISGSEAEVLTRFWNQLSKYDCFITFNGRCFDGPFLMIRSAINKIKASKNLMPYRYDHKAHVDLADQLNFYGAASCRFSLHMWCKAFGIDSPKDGGMTGLQVKEYYQAGRYLDIARYCFGDLKATKELFLYWDRFLKF